MAERDGAVGLLAGVGTFPEVIARAVKCAGRALVCVQVAGDSPALYALADHYWRCTPGALGEVLGTLQAHRVQEVLVAGRFSRADLLGAGDAVRDAVMARQADRRDIPLLESLAALLAEQGIVLVDQTRFVGDLLAPPGVLTARPPTPEEEADLAFGRTVARRLADLDVGQTVVLRRGIILAVEAAEGTDATIRRGGAMAPETVVVKVSRNNQDPRFDIPAVGPDTIAAMREAAARVLGIDARRTLLLHRTRMLAEADAAEITVVAADVPPLGHPVHAHP
ncbi:MAG: UDP-2,3-diacylglucosamine diphosphatase LpxI [Armatimonadota bacterium]|nr:UDP-2,3-diacylglucosamine diphosphatase LpxI [Armatimonadota bacterium]MDR7519322.1 UDP-2,3-diacylglucosamine diphosphatase LpxI [Armatimonadota bacterium]